MGAYHAKPPIVMKLAVNTRYGRFYAAAVFSGIYKVPCVGSCSSHFDQAECASQMPALYLGMSYKRVSYFQQQSHQVKPHLQNAHCWPRSRGDSPYCSKSVQNDTVCTYAVRN